MQGQLAYKGITKRSSHAGISELLSAKVRVVDMVEGIKEKEWLLPCKEKPQQGK